MLQQKSRTPKYTRQIEYKDIGADSMRATNEVQGMVEGILNKTGVIDEQQDRTIPGCFRKTLQDSRARKVAQDLDYLWPALLSHDWQNQLPFGGVVNAEETKSGLYVRIQCNMDIQLGRDVFYSCKNGFISKMSMGYKTIRSSYEKIGDKTIRNIEECAVLEASVCVFPANDESQILSVKSGGASMLMHAKDFDSRYHDQQLDDWECADWFDLTFALHQSVLDLFAPGGSPEADLESQVIPGLLTALRAYVQEGISLGYTGQDMNSDSSMPSMMSAYASVQELKEGRALSLENANKLQTALSHITTGATHVRAVLRQSGPPAPKPGSGPSPAATRQRLRDLTGYPRIASADPVLEGLRDLSASLGQGASPSRLEELEAKLRVDLALRELQQTLANSDNDESDLTMKDRLRIEKMNGG